MDVLFSLFKTIALFARMDTLSRLTATLAQQHPAQMATLDKTTRALLIPDVQVKLFRIIVHLAQVGQSNS